MNQSSDQKVEATQREQMIEFITRTVRKVSERKLRNIYHFILHIS